MNHSSLKKSLIIAMSCIPKVEGLEENNLILTTSAGIISGKVPSEQEIDDENSLCGVLYEICDNTKEEYLKNISSTDSEPVIVGNDGYIILKDVKIRSTSSDTITHMNFMVVFYDQIIGVTIGNIN
mgnify:FL=1|jgi:hypothetical protein|uniref:Uncharacterized protein n=1 Tax=Siphoviridae sp. ctA995 TaxID=2826180 RepID=A0A8S5LYT0_9CAUD|nr:MAG TPA: hypothetical protein [Siphoviridae sp. ctA995]DAV84218.1 MAG TPA: hypothetical protein [Caudoviricetes sp.]